MTTSTYTGSTITTSIMVVGENVPDVTTPPSSAPAPTTTPTVTCGTTPSNCAVYNVYKWVNTGVVVKPNGDMDGTYGSELVDGNLLSGGDGSSEIACGGNRHWIINKGQIASLKFKINTPAAGYADTYAFTNTETAQGAQYPLEFAIDTCPGVINKNTAINYGDNSSSCGVICTTGYHSTPASKNDPTKFVVPGKFYYLNMRLGSSHREAESTVFYLGTQTRRKASTVSNINTGLPTPTTNPPTGTTTCGSLPANTTIIDKGTISSDTSGALEGNWNNGRTPKQWKIDTNQIVAIKYTVPNNPNLHIQFGFNEIPESVYGDKLTYSVSSCPGVFTGSSVLSKGDVGMIGNIHGGVTNTWYTPSATTLPRLTPGKTYYLNLKATGSDMYFIMSITVMTVSPPTPTTVKCTNVPGCKIYDTRPVYSGPGGTVPIRSMDFVNHITSEQAFIVPNNGVMSIKINIPRATYMEGSPPQPYYMLSLMGHSSYIILKHIWSISECYGDFNVPNNQKGTDATNFALALITPLYTKVVNSALPKYIRISFDKTYYLNFKATEENPYVDTNGQITNQFGFMVVASA